MYARMYVPAYNSLRGYLIVECEQKSDSVRVLRDNAEAPATVHQPRLCVYVFVCMYVCMYVCIYIYIYIYIYKQLGYSLNEQMSKLRIVLAVSMYVCMYACIPPQ